MQQNNNPQVDDTRPTPGHARKATNFSIYSRRLPWQVWMRNPQRSVEPEEWGEWRRWRGNYRSAKTRDAALENPRRKYQNDRLQFMAVDE